MTRKTTNREDLGRRLLGRLAKTKRKYAQIDKLAKTLRVRSADLETTVDRLVAEGEILRARKGRIALASRLGRITGRLSVSRHGRAVVITDLPEAPISIPAARVRPAMHGDRVLVEATPYRRGSRGLRSGWACCSVMARAPWAAAGPGR